MGQIALPLDMLRPGESTSLFITPSNEDIAASLNDSDNWPGNCAILCGPPRSGKTLLSQYFLNQRLGKGDIQVIDNADSVSEETLFNAWNRAQITGGALLLVSRHVPADWQIALPDLRSRLGSALLLQIAPPDDDLLQQLIQKHLSDRGTVISDKALAYVCKRIERRYGAIESFAQQASIRSLELNSALNVNVVKTILSLI
jgi:hypothetical protein